MDRMVPIGLTSLIIIRREVLTEKVMMKSVQPHRFIFQTPMYAMKLAATSKPNNAGYQSPSFLTEGENTAGREKTIQKKPMMQTIEIKIGRFLILVSILCYE